MPKLSIYLLAGALVVGAYGLISYQSSRIDTLTEELKASQQVAKQNAEAVDDLRAQYADIEYRTTEMNVRMDKIKVENEKLRKDSKKAHVVASKPGLVEKQINKSFDSFAEDFRSITE